MIRRHPFQSRCCRPPSMTRSWGTVEFEIMQSLTMCVRVMSTRQINRIWGDPSVHLGRLQQAHLVERYLVNTHPTLEPKRPLFAWEPNGRPPQCKRLSEKARNRWCQVAQPSEVYTASKKSANLFATGFQGLPPIEHRDHDLLLADAYVVYRRALAHSTNHWIGEDYVPKAGFRTKDPDAFLVDAEGHPIRIIESGGRYSARQIEDFHDYCESLDLPYELW